MLLPLAHILPNSIVPGAAQWGAIALGAVGGIGVLRRRTPRVDLLSWVGFLTGSTAIVVMVGIGFVAPQAPGYSLFLAVSSHGTSPVPVSVCAQYPAGTYAKTPDGDHVLAAVVDGAATSYQITSHFAVTMTPGTHTLKIELLSRDHREFTPVVATTAHITVTGAAAPTDWVSCPAN